MYSNAWSPVGGSVWVVLSGVKKHKPFPLSTLWLNSKLLMEHHACLPVAKLPTMMPIGL